MSNIFDHLEGIYRLVTGCYSAASGAEAVGRAWTVVPYLASKNDRCGTESVAEELCVRMAISDPIRTFRMLANLRVVRG